MTPPSALIYGPTGIGKTTAALRALDPARTFWIVTERSGDAVAFDATLNPWPTTPRSTGLVADVLDFDQAHRELTAAVGRAVELVHAGRVGAVVLDTLSSFARRETDRLIGPTARKDPYAESARLTARHVQEAIDRLLASGAILVATAHEQGPSELSGRRGGPKLPGRMVEDVPSMFDAVLRCRVETGVDGVRRRRFAADPIDPAWVSKDRWNLVGPEGADMDLRSWLRAAIVKSRNHQPAGA